MATKKKTVKKRSDDPAFAGSGYAGLTIREYTFIQIVGALQAGDRDRFSTWDEIVEEARDLTWTACKELDSPWVTPTPAEILEARRLKEN